MIDLVKRQSNKSGIISAILFYALLTALLTAIFCGSLLVTGVNNEHIQKVLRKNLKTSVNQFVLEGEYPYPLHKGDPSYRLDNYTDTIILQQAYLMDTTQDPTVIFSNPFVSKSYGDSEIADRILALEEARKNQEGNSHYTHYWIGIRTLIRLLLYFFSYQNIRGILSITFIAMWFVASAYVYRAVGKTTGTAFFVAVLCMNIPIVTSEIQFVPCFYVMFVTIMTVVRFREQFQYAPIILFITGAATQFFDFYTYPLITLGFPLIVLAMLLYRQSVKNSSLLLVKCILAWFLAYAGFWLIRLLLVEMFTEYDDTVSRAFGKFRNWTGLAAESQIDTSTVKDTFGRFFETLFNPHNVLLFAIALAYEVILVVKGIIKRQFSRPVGWLLVIALFPVVWILLSLKTAERHYWFQYRMLSVLVFGVLTFIGSMINTTEKPALLT